MLRRLRRSGMVIRTIILRPTSPLMSGRLPYEDRTPSGRNPVAMRLRAPRLHLFDETLVWG